MMEVVLIVGPAGVGKTSVANELSLQLRAAGVAHAVVDTDALDDVFPVPQEQWRLTERHLAAIWRTYRELGTDRLILTGVRLHEPGERAWIRRATGPERLTVIRLDASDAALEQRVRQREIGSGAAAQLERTRLQAGELRAAEDMTVIETDERPVAEIAAEIAVLVGWV
jgi:molybdopterin-guanine dinucleotide biosynthesis protein